MIKFEEHDGLIFRMLEEPVPLKENDENVLVRFITHGIIGEYVMNHWLDCNQKNVPIYIDDVDSDGDVTVWIDEKRNEHHCCPYPMFEIIGTLVEEGSADWALYQMMQGEKVFRAEWECDMYCQYTNNAIITFRHGIPSTINSVEEWIANAKKADFGWQIYKDPKPLLADAGIGDIVKTNLGDWLQIVDTPCLRFGHNECYRTHDGLYWDECGVCDVDSTYRLVAVESLAPEGSAEWAWQMLKLGKKVTNNKVFIYGGYVKDTDSDKKQFCLNWNNRDGWQIYEEPQADSEPQPTKEPIANCKYCKHVCTNSNIDYCHMYEPKPESEYKVGDWVEWSEGLGISYQSQITRVSQSAVYGKGICIPLKIITRKLKPSEVIVEIGCLSGTVRPVSTNGTHIWFHLIGVDDKTIAIIRISCLDTPTRSLVESLLKAQKEEQSND